MLQAATGLWCGGHHGANEVQAAVPWCSRSLALALWEAAGGSAAPAVALLRVLRGLLGVEVAAVRVAAGTAHGGGGGGGAAVVLRRFRRACRARRRLYECCCSSGGCSAAVEAQEDEEEEKEWETWEGRAPAVSFDQLESWLCWVLEQVEALCQQLQVCHFSLFLPFFFFRSLLPCCHRPCSQGAEKKRRGEACNA